MKMIQKGKNEKYPREIYTWGLGEEVPSWLSDNAQVKFIDGDGNITLGMNKLTTGGREIIRADGKGILVRLVTGDSRVCYTPGKPIFTLKPKQLELLYRKVV